MSPAFFQRTGLRLLAAMAFLIPTFDPIMAGGRAAAPGPQIADIGSAAVREMNQGVELAKQGDFFMAPRHMAWAWDALSEDQKKRPPPGLLFNTALVHDLRPGRQLAAVLWYEAFLAAAPSESARARDVRERVSVLLREFDALQAAKVRFIENVFSEMTGLLHERMYSWELQDADSKAANDAEADRIGTAVANAAATWIYLGHEATGLDLLSRYGRTYLASDAAMIALLARGNDEKARSFASSEAEFLETKDIIASIRENIREACRKNGPLELLLLLGQSIESLYTDGYPDDERRDIESAWGRQQLADNFGRDVVTSHDHVLFTHAVAAVAQARWHYRTIREICG